MPPLEGDLAEAEGKQDAVAAKEELYTLVRVQKGLCPKVVDLSLQVKNGSKKVREISDLRLERELKISGTIGVPGETYKLNFMSLVCQTEGPWYRDTAKVK